MDYRGKAPWVDDDEVLIKSDDDNNINYDGEGCNDQSTKMLNNEETNDEWNEEQYKSFVELTPDDIIGMEFGSAEKAYEFYCAYARCNGFVVRKADIKRNVRGEITSRQYVCNREGLRDKKHIMRVDRKREHRALTRTKCSARMRIYANKGGAGWKVTIFDDVHNHHLVSVDKVHMISAYRNLKEADKVQINNMHSMGVRTCHIFGFMSGQAGGYSGLGFCKKDLYNHISRERKAKIVDGDAYAALSYLQAKSDSDLMFWGKYEVNEIDGRLLNLFWADGTSRIDYECFGDVVAFDSTYKVNKYNKPLVIFSGANHHGLTCLFGCALLSNESFESYKWVLTSFLEAMGGKEPNVVVTDGDKAMRKAIEVVMPSSSHRLCSWHMNKNAASNVHNADFLKKFKECVYANFDPDEFEEFWANMVEEFGLHNNAWVKKAYKTKEMWATAFHREKFYFGIRTTSRCEGINSLMKKYTNSHNSLVEFVHNYERVVQEYRNNELVADFNSRYGDPVLTSALESLEKGAANIYTRAMYKEFKIELNEAAAYFVVQCDESEDTILFKLNKYCRPRRIYEVMLKKNEEKFVCYCRSYESNGIPCAHIICVLKYKHIAELPPSLICHRWTKSAKIVNTPQGDEDTNDKKAFMLRYGSLASSCNRLSFLAAQKREDFNEVRSEICRLTFKLEKQRSKTVDKDGNSTCGVKDPSIDVNDPLIDVKDPSIVKIKGAPKKKMKSGKLLEGSKCHTVGHTRKRCKNTIDANQNDTKKPAQTSFNRSAMALQDSASQNKSLPRNMAGPSQNESSQHIVQVHGIETMSNTQTHLNPAYYGAAVHGQFGQVTMLPNGNYIPMYPPNVGATMFLYGHGPSLMSQGFGGVPFIQSPSPFCYDYGTGQPYMGDRKDT